MIEYLIVYNNREYQVKCDAIQPTLFNGALYGHTFLSSNAVILGFAPLGALIYKV